MKQKLDAYMNEMINTYYADNAKKLNTVVDHIFITHYGGIAGRICAENMVFRRRFVRLFRWRERL